MEGNNDHSNPRPTLGMAGNELAPPDDEPAMTILLTSPGQPDRIIEVHGDKNAGRRRPQIHSICL
jgi:hypothetical protein